ncbi:sodium:proton antiporter [Prolixibacter sp. SD074]|uniref:cation:proton antiporter n=1 Tax=Prolixibacter sp. SD074 TaxID=2652391 RepID=UPI0012737D97|nr:sodium:proton antiporter [Prolixibacter sp. SD074]GET28460.1 sodium:proton antiporter [Prolixibacter sp. SD074]
MSHVNLIDLTILTVLTLGFIAFLLSEKVHISSIPILVILGFLFGPVFGLIPNAQGHTIFNYARVLGLVLILYTEGHNLKWSMIKKHVTTIGLMDTVGLLLTAAISGFLFSYVFDLPLGAGLLFGTIVSATDPATLIPLFKQNKVDENIKTVIVTESIFNDPLAIVLSTLAIAMVAPHADQAHLIETIAHYTTIYPAGIIYFLYVMVSSLALGVGLGVIGYWFIRWLKPGFFPQIFGISIAFGGFLIGEAVQTSGYLVATIIGIVFGNHAIMFKRWNEHEGFNQFIREEMHFNEIISDMASVFIFILFGATINISVLNETLLKGALIALGVVFIARPLAALIIVPLKKWTFKEYLFIALEGPRGVVPAALAGVPLSIGFMNHDQSLIYWGEIILSATIMTVLISVLLETLWVKTLSRKLLSPKE